MALKREYPHSFSEALRVSKEILSAHHGLIKKGTIDSESEQIVAAAFRNATGTRLTRMELFARMTDRFPEKAGELVLMYSTARATGKLLQHLTGFQAFLAHDYEVGPDVLVPRPETEILVLQAIQYLQRQPVPPLTGIEIGVGSGIISIELLAKFQNLEMFASDTSPGALNRARANAQKILGSSGASRLRLLATSRADAVWEPFVEEKDFSKADFLISNPPYLVPGDPIESEVLQHEPHVALFAPTIEPVFFYEKIATEARQYLKKNAMIFVEMSAERAEPIRKVFEENNWLTAIERDLNGFERVLIAKNP